MAAPSVDDLARSFERYLRAGNKSPRTVEPYLEALAGFSATSKRPLDQASREDRLRHKDFEARRDTAVLMVLLDAGHAARDRAACAWRSPLGGGD
jgi:hypothetical protein